VSASSRLGLSRSGTNDFSWRLAEAESPMGVLLQASD
jgi:hypothetical protein